VVAAVAGAELDDNEGMGCDNDGEGTTAEIDGVDCGLSPLLGVEVAADKAGDDNDE